MKEINYYCDICKEKIPNPMEEKTCIKINIDEVKNWENDVTRARLLQDIRVCHKCGTNINDMINRLKKENNV